MRTRIEIEKEFSPTTELRKDRPFYLVGIGGAGMSSLALMLAKRGVQVRGSDSTASPVTESLERAGIPVDIGHFQARIEESEQVVLSDAISLDSPEVVQARSKGCHLFRRSQLLGWLLQGKKLVAVTGTHGKTTTTGMIGVGLRSAGVDATVVVGAVVPEFGSAVVEGTAEIAVAEACEAYDSFHDLDPFVVVLTNLELDHVDFHGTWDKLLDSVCRFVSRIPKGGALIYCQEDPGACEVASKFEGNKIGYSAKEAEGLDLLLAGRHNRLNAAAAKSVLNFFSAELGHVGIEAFRGAERRLQVLKEGDIVVVDDYAHHPTEIAASIEALREAYPGRRLVVVYQPHLYSRTANLIPEFAEALSLADFVVVTDIYPAREVPMPGISSARIAELISKPHRYVPQRHLLPRRVRAICQPNDVIVGMGAGNISEFAPDFVAELTRPTWKDAEEGASLRIAVVYGGDSAEREVSLHSGLAVAEALRSRGHEPKLVDLSEQLLSGRSLAWLAGPDRPDAVLLAVHGTNAEDGAVQGLLELLDLPYSGSGIQSSAIAMDKELAKAILASKGIRVPKGAVAWSAADDVSSVPGPWAVKPNAQGSTVGLTFVEDAKDLPEAIAKALCYGPPALVEQRIFGMEVSVPVLGDRALNPVEIVPNSGQYDFASKYLPGATEEVVPARLPGETLELLKDISLSCHRALSCRGATRVDMIVSETGEITVLEVNTLPGMTATSLLPNSARSMGISMEDLCHWMVVDAMRCHAQKG